MSQWATRWCSRRPLGCVVSRNVGDAQEDTAQFVVHLASGLLGLLLLRAEGLALLPLGLAGGLVTRAKRLADLLGERVDPAPDLVAPGDGVALLLVEISGSVEHRRVDTAARQALLEDIQLRAQAPGIQHGCDGSVRSGGDAVVGGEVAGA
jgi:hypothetical protein